MARIVAKALGDRLGQSVVVDNKPGADGALAADAVIKADADGHTLFFATNTPILAVPTLRLKPPYDPLSVFAPIAIVGRSDFFLFVHPGVRANSLGELVGLGKTNPGKLNFATGNATGVLATAQLAKSAGMVVTQVPYKGEASAFPDLLSGRVDAMVASTTSLLAHSKDRKLKVLAVLGDHRSTLAPNVPTFSETDLASSAVVPWVGIFTSSKTDAAIRKRLTSEINVVLSQPEVAKQIALQGTRVEPMSTVAFGNFIEQQMKLWKRIVDETGVARE